MISDFKNRAFENYQREPLVFSGAYVLCRDTEKEAQDALQAILDDADRQAVRNLMQVLGAQSGSFDHLIQKAAEDRFITGYGGALGVSASISSNSTFFCWSSARARAQ